jgi:hypothetical protein
MLRLSRAQSGPLISPTHLCTWSSRPTESATAPLTCVASLERSSERAPLLLASLSNHPISCLRIACRTHKIGQTGCTYHQPPAENETISVMWKIWWRRCRALAVCLVSCKNQLWTASPGCEVGISMLWKFTLNSTSLMRRASTCAMIPKQTLKHAGWRRLWIRL